MIRLRLDITLILMILVGSTAVAQSVENLSEQMAETVMQTHPDSICYDKTKPAKWEYEQGVVLRSIEQVWRRTGDGKYFAYLQKLMDFYVQPDGSIRTYKLDNFNIDHITPGRMCLLLYQQTGKDKYRKAAKTLREQLSKQPRTKEGGFWHKKIYPDQMWLDGLYMGEPFYAEYSLMFHELQNFDDIANQFIWMEHHAVDAKTGLLYHGYDESRKMDWADKATGHSPNFWGRGMGWYGMALVDVLEHFPKDHAKRKDLEVILQRYAAAVVKVQDSKSGVWYQVLDKANEKGNYLEASASAMFTYALLKGVRLGILEAHYLGNARKAYAGMKREFITRDSSGMVHLDHTCNGAGLGGVPYRDGSFAYYIGERQRTDDLKGVGPFIQASVEMEMLEQPKIGHGKRVVLDYFFNHETRKNADGGIERFHYTWEDPTNSGFQFWGDVFRDFGAILDTLADAPTVENLKKASVYIIVDPDTKKETESPNYVEKVHIEAIRKWVERGGVLVLLANDTANCEIPKFNNLARVFGIQFTDKSRNMVKNNQFEQGAVAISPGNAIFKTSKKMFIKELSVLSTVTPAIGEVVNDGDIIVASAKYGKGTVLAIGDPVFYNEYVDGRKIPMIYENFKASKDLASWLLLQSK